MDECCEKGDCYFYLLFLPSMKCSSIFLDSMYVLEIE